MYFGNFCGGINEALISGASTTKQAPTSYCITSESFTVSPERGYFEVVRTFSTPAGVDHTEEINIAFLGNVKA